MRKNNFTNWDKVETIINKCETCSLAMVDENNMPYVLPFNFGYENKTIYFHGAKMGKKIDILKKNPNVCIAFSTDNVLQFQNENVGCSYSMKFRSVVACGKAEFIGNFEEKTRVLNIVMKKYANRDNFTFNTPAVNNIEIFKVEVTSVTGKESGY